MDGAEVPLFEAQYTGQTELVQVRLDIQRIVDKPQIGTWKAVMR